MPIPEKGLVYTGSQEPKPPRAGVRERSIQIQVGHADLVGDLAVPEHATGLVIFAHGSGSSRLSPRNRYVAGILNGSGLATLLVDLLTIQEEHVDVQTREFRFNIGLLAERLIGLTEWQTAHPDVSALALGYFGASTGSAAALIAAAARPERVRALVSRGGRPDLASSSLPRVQSPTLFIVGGDDAPVIELNQQAFDVLQCDKKLEIVPGATHLFEEPGALESVAHLAADWYREHICNG